jgi:hypothetical protein
MSGWRIWLEKFFFIYCNLRMLTKQFQAKDLDPILLDKIDLVSYWLLEAESHVDDLSWIMKRLRISLLFHSLEWKQHIHLHHNCCFNIVMLELVHRGLILGVLIVMHDTRDWTWRNCFFS